MRSSDGISAAMRANEATTPAEKTDRPIANFHPEAPTISDTTSTIANDAAMTRTQTMRA